MGFFAMIVVVFGVYFAYLFEPHRVESEFNSEKCEPVFPELPPCEDMQKYSDHELIAACGDLTGVTDDTFLMLLDIDLMDYKRLPIHNFPKNVKINPHGMYIYEKKELWLINHAYGKGGERLDVFDLKKNNGELSLHWKYDLSVDSTLHAVFNDVFVATESEYFVTQWITKPLNHDLPKNVLDRDTFWEKLKVMTKTATCFVHRCTHQNGENHTCEIFSDDFMMANGINSDGKYLYVADARKYEVKVLDMKTGATLKTIDTGKHMGDNIEFDEDTGLLFTAGGHSFLQMILYFDDNPNNVLFGFSGFHPYKEGVAQKPTESYFLQDKLKGLSVCNFFQKSNTAFCGSFKEGGLLKCSGIQI